MARFFKNPDLTKGGRLAARLPIVPNTSYGDAPTNGIIRFNQATSRIEFYYNGAWSSVAKIGSVQLVVDSFAGDGTTTAFINAMSQAETDPTAIIVTIGGVYQQPTTHYSVSGQTITFVSPPPAPGVNPNQIVIIHNINSTNVSA